MLTLVILEHGVFSGTHLEERYLGLEGELARRDFGPISPLRPGFL
jgi:hypothetical protein